MGRKRWWKGGLELLVLCFFQSVIHGDGEVGCLFSKNVCRPGVETCYDDLAFGRCIRPFGELDDEDVYRYDLDASELELLRERLERLVVDGYEWTHPYTQCIMQGSLYSLRYRLKDDLEFCQDLAELDEGPFNEYEEDEEPQEEPQPLAVVNFTPTRGHGYGDFADEKYYPPAASLKKPKHSRRPLNDDSEEDYTYAYSSFRKKPERQRVAKLEDIIVDDGNLNEENPNDENMLMDSPEGSNYVEPNFEPASRNFRELAQRLDVKYDQPMYRLRRQPHHDQELLQNFKTSSFKLDDYVKSAKDILRDSDREISKVGRDYRYWGPGLDKYLWKFTKDGLLVANETLPESSNGNMGGLEFLRNDYEDEGDGEEDDRWMNRNTGDEEEEEEDNNEPEARESMMKVHGSLDRSTNRHKGGMYTEGGLVQPLDIRDAIRQVSVPDDIVFDDDLLLWSRDLAAFQRNERLDVKKPGPLFSTNNYAFKTQSPPAPAVNDDESLEDQHKKGQILRSPLIKKKVSDDNEQTYENVDLDHVYIQFDSDFTNWDDGEKVVEEVARLLGYSPDVFSEVRVGRAEVTFKVSGESPNDAINIAPKIDGIREELRKSTGRVVVRAGVGDKVKLPPSMEVEIAPKTMSTGVFGAIVAAGGAAAAAAAVVTLIIARKHAKSRAKLAGLATPDPEASKDYQDLCRARMQAKQPNEKPESPRIISLSRESESNRSSTSSWGEEAAALTNMDISTGHMVLTYMEDHLKNKDRLDQEWAGICAYEAEPSSVAIATDKSNADRNRPGSSLPYDHSRLVLNDLSNAVNSDYINASTITDHDPRNPAYIATQGPLPQTSADFWQLVWEQGSVVIVMLTRLTEEGRGMCHRYWPEEGSELYHIYEVHLVSEHIWCDDYLVRSFYLKNLRTGETRTVTQFHFLSWPENGVPQSTKAMLEFRRKVNKSYRGRSCPIVVHCSDGAGRTGTYCLIDMVLNRMAKGAKEIDIAAALEHIRDQRPGMVATKQQFEFVLGAVAEEVHAILKALPVQPVTEKSQSAGTPASAAQSSSGSEQ